MKKLTTQNLRKVERENQAKKNERIESFLMEQSVIVASNEQQYDAAVHSPKVTAIDPKRLFYKAIGDKRYGTVKEAKHKDSVGSSSKENSRKPSLVSLAFQKVIPRIHHHNH